MIYHIMAEHYAHIIVGNMGSQENRAMGSLQTMLVF